MPKLKDLLKTINGPLANNEIEALMGAGDLQTAMEFEIADNTLDEIKSKFNSFITVEDAKTNPVVAAHFKTDLFPKIKGELLGNIDTQIDKTAKDLFGADMAGEFEKIEFTKDKVKRLNEEIVKKMAAGSDDEKLKKQLKTAHDRIIEMDKIHKSEIDSKVNEFKSAQSDFNKKLTRGQFINKAKSIKWGKSYEEIKDDLTSVNLSKMSQIGTLRLNEHSNLELKDKNDPALDYVEDGKKVDFDTKFNQLFDPFKQKSPGTTTPPGEPYKPAPPSNNLSPEQLRRIEARTSSN